MSTTSFLPEDYLDQKAERRTNLISLSLFGIVMVSVFAAFLVTNRQWSQVKNDRALINAQYEDVAGFETSGRAYYGGFRLDFP